MGVSACECEIVCEHVWVSACVCEIVCEHVCECEIVWACVWAWDCVWACVSVSACVSVRLCVSMCVSVRLCVSMCECERVCVQKWRRRFRKLNPTQRLRLFRSGRANWGYIPPYLNCRWKHNQIPKGVLFGVTNGAYSPKQKQSQGSVPSHVVKTLYNLSASHFRHSNIAQRDTHDKTKY